MGKLERSGIPLSLVARIDCGTYVTHGECYMDDPKDYSRDFLAVEELFKGNPGSALALQDRFWMHSLILYIYVIAVGTLILRLRRKLLYDLSGQEIKPEWAFDLPVKTLLSTFERRSTF